MKYPITYELSSHLNAVKPFQHVLACDYQRGDKSIGKCFTIIDNISTDIGKQQMTALIKGYGNHWYEILQENIPTKIFVDIETSNGDYNKVKCGVEAMVKMINIWCEEKDIKNFDNFYVLDSSNDKKISFHIIGGPYMKNSYHVGALIRRITFFIYAARNTEGVKDNFNLEYFFDKDNNFIIDEQIYTRNRQFRLAGQCKMGSERILRGIGTFSSFLQYHGHDFNECLEVDESEPMSTSKGAHNLFVNIDGEWARLDGKTSLTLKTIKSELPDVLSTLRVYLENWLGEGRITVSAFDIITGAWRLSTSSQICHIAKRKHAHNHIWLVVNPFRQRCYQKCFDENCRGEHDIEIPEHLWSKWSECTKKTVGINVKV
tara:strand:- start:350 stop:1471 length:1122 start_codon:yes stop_codon:yes gene_type:complete